jgi:hypothetical protein
LPGKPLHLKNRAAAVPVYAIARQENEEEMWP